MASGNAAVLPSCRVAMFRTGTGTGTGIGTGIRIGIGVLRSMSPGPCRCISPDATSNPLRTSTLQHAGSHLQLGPILSPTHFTHFRNKAISPAETGPLLVFENGTPAALPWPGGAATKNRLVGVSKQKNRNLHSSPCITSECRYERSAKEGVCACVLVAFKVAGFLLSLGMPSFAQNYFAPETEKSIIR